MRLKLCFVLAVCGLTGCGGGSDDMPDVGQVTGVVTLDDAPLADARVYFSPTEGGRTSEAVTDAEGKYELRYMRDIMGAKVGQHSVRVTTGSPAVIGDDGKVETPAIPEKVPAKYNTESTLTKEVTAGDQEIDLPLTSS
ncbi:carboxypeptidase-like regulatory domain-containing protein [Thalassoroseus pseudoceratinae]|uniref:carboxypeptidase-like regulatory domain-containing protein n=1 Tax=Thalassoroseus pseudoceratinae TaxID=2713176 RepID=UPI001423D542|nr:carboxypeptidase-like regulatory domain-containing protein [Thalassoroseus pseudoceratinae]